MYDIGFYMRVNELKRTLENGEKVDKDLLFDQLEQIRSKKPVVYNIETTNACNMTCQMCPRTTSMTRSISTMKQDLFTTIANQLEPHSPELWAEWERFCEKEYGIPSNGMGENHFFLYIIPKIIQLHGYGDPLLDKNLGKDIALLTEKGIGSYFSCNPANINIERTEEMFRNGLNYLKYSIESVDDTTHKIIRGDQSNFTESYKKIQELLKIKEQKNYKTTIIITMIDLNRKDQQAEFAKLKKAFEGLDVYIYLKSEDQQWYRKDAHGTNSVHWSEFCKHPWMSMTIKSNGEAAMCMEDFNNEIILGDATKQTLEEIWNGDKYRQFRLDHINLKNGFKCNEQCDMKLVGQYLQQ
jgi:radical SAM protein with 4Fe4S-binding SPASM domain